jgi:DNA-binding NtrC family response regulator
MSTDIRYVLISPGGDEIGETSIPGFVPEGYKLEYDGEVYIVVTATLRPARYNHIMRHVKAVVRPLKQYYEDNDLTRLPIREARERWEREYLTAQVSRFGGNISRTAEFVGMERSALHRKMRELKVLGYGESREAAFA